jgi:hypothetical protein
MKVLVYSSDLYYRDMRDQIIDDDKQMRLLTFIPSRISHTRPHENSGQR